MRPGRELDVIIAEQVFNHKVFIKKRVPYELTPQGDRPLRFYSTEIQAAWEIVEAMNITLIPIENGTWFALVGPNDGWKSPADFIGYLQTGKFVKSGAAVEKTAPLSICLAAQSAIASRNLQNSRPENEASTSSAELLQ